MINTNYYVMQVIKILKKQYIFVAIFSVLILLIIFKLVEPVMNMSSYIHPFDINGTKFKFRITPEAFKTLKLLFNIFSTLAVIAFINSIYERFLFDIFNREKTVKPYDIKFIKYSYDKNQLRLILGLVHNETNKDLVLKPWYETIDFDGLFQNVLCTGTIGTGKTITFITNVTVQLIYYKFDNVKEKVAALFLDVKGNFYKFIHAFAKECGRWDDVITIELGGKWKYNPLHKPNLNEIEIANRMRYILELFSGVGNEPFWIDKAEDTIVEYLKLIRLYNNGYINFEELHYMATKEVYRYEKTQELLEQSKEGLLNSDQQYSLNTAIAYFENDYDKLDDKAKGFIKSEITRMTQPFISTKVVKDTFCPSRDEITFYGFEDVIKEGKIVVWKINANKEPKVAKLIAAYLKLDFQKEILITLEKKHSDPVSANRIKTILCDEYQEYCTRNDAEFLSQSREAKSISIAATQSYSSIKQALKNDETMTSMLLQSFVNKIWLRSDDVDYTVPKVMKQIAKIDTEKITKNITETARSSTINYSLGKVLSKAKNLSSGTSISTQKDFKFDEKFLVQDLDTGQAICFLSDGKKIKAPKLVHLNKLFEGRILCENGEIKFTTDTEKIFKLIGAVDLEKLENETIQAVKDDEPIKQDMDFYKLPYEVEKSPEKKPELVFVLNKKAEDAATKEQEEKDMQEAEPKERNLFDDISKDWM